MARKKKSSADEPKRGPTFLRAWRKYRKLTQEAVAERVGVDRTTIGRIENGELPYNQDFLEKVALIYGCEPEDLLAIDPLRPDPPKLVYNQLKIASPEIQQRAIAVLDALLKTG